MRAFEIQKTFGLEALTLMERPDPVPGPRQVLVGMHAASLNFRDLLMVQGLYYPKQPLPFVPLSDGVGEVSAGGAGVASEGGQRDGGHLSARMDSQASRPRSEAPLRPRRAARRHARERVMLEAEGSYERFRRSPTRKPRRCRAPP